MKNPKLMLIFSFAGSMLFASCEKKVIVQNPVPAQETARDVQLADSSSSAASAVQNQDLPKKVKDFLNQYYPNATIAAYEVKTIPAIGKKYEVKLNNGAEIDFDSNGNWEEISDKQGVPDTLIPTSIKSYVSKNYQGTKIESIDKERNKIKVELINDLDLEFDLKGNFLRIDP